MKSAPLKEELEVARLLGESLELDKNIIKNINNIIEAYQEKKRRIQLTMRAGMRLASAIKRGASVSHKRHLSAEWSEAKRRRDLYKIV